MAILFGSARIDENGNIKGGKAGDQTGKEVSTQEFYMHSKGWVGFKAKDSALAEKLARGMQIACDNPNLGYDQNERLGVIKNGIESKVKTECDCSSLVRAVLKYAGVDVCNFTTATAKAVIMATGLFDEVKINSAADVTNGMILCTKTKGHIVIVISGAERTTVNKGDLFGIDVSHYQGNIDWGRVKATGKVEFAIMKAMYETSKRADETFEKNYISCGTNGISRGVYNFIGAVSASDPVADAKAFLKILNGRKLELGIWLDVESKNLRKLGKEKIESVILKETEIYESAGYNVGIYCNYDWYKNVITDKIKKVFEGRFWIARYPKKDVGQYNTKSTLSPKSYAVAWQYSSKGKVDGIAGNVDMDVCYKPIGEIFGTTNKPVEETGKITCPYAVPAVCVTSKLNAILKRFKGKYVTKGEAVGYVQWHLNRLGYDLGKGGIDLKCGGDTTNAIGEFQKDHGLKQDKIAGPKTYASMEKTNG